MKIVKIETAKVNIPLVTPFKTALRTVDSVNDIVVRITTDDGQTGFGEAPPTAVITGIPMVPFFLLLRNSLLRPLLEWRLKIWMES